MFVLTIGYFIISIMLLALCSFLPILVWFRDLYFCLILLADWYISVDDANWKFKQQLLFFNMNIFLDFLIMSLFKLLINCLCCILLTVNILLLLHIDAVITFCKSVICIYDCDILHFFCLQTIYVMCGFVNCILV